MTQECQDDNHRVIKDVGRYQISVYRDMIPRGLTGRGAIVVLAEMIIIILILAWITTTTIPVDNPNYVTMSLIVVITITFGALGIPITLLVITTPSDPGYTVVLMKKTTPPQAPVERISFKKSSSQEDDKKQLQGIVADLEKRATRYNNRCDDLRKESDDLVSGL